MDLTDEARIRKIVRQEIASLFSPIAVRKVKMALQGQIPQPKMATRNIDLVIAAMEKVMWEQWNLG